MLADFAIDSNLNQHGIGAHFHMDYHSVPIFFFFLINTRLELSLTMDAILDWDCTGYYFIMELALEYHL